MTKFAKMSIVLGISLICISMLITSFNFNTLFKPFSDKDAYETLEYYANNIDTLTVDIYNDKINLVPYNGTEIKITYYENDEYKYNIREEGGNLIIDKPVVFQFFNFNFNTFTPEIKIEVPYDLVITYNIKTSNAKITIDSIRLLDSEFKTSNASISLANINNVDLIKLKTTNGKVSVSNTQINNLDVQSSNGSIKLNGCEISKINLKTSNGSIELENVVSSNQTIAKTSNGRIEFANLKSPIIDLKTSNSRVEGTVSGSTYDYQKNIKTSNGEIMLDGNDEGTSYIDNTTSNNKLIIKTSNANIDINFR